MGPQYRMTYKVVRTKPRCGLDDVRQILQVSQRGLAELLGSLIEEYAPDSEIRVGAFLRPSCVGLNVPADQRGVAGRVCGRNVAQQAHVAVGCEFGDLPGIIAIWQGIRTWSAAGINHHGEVDFGVS